MEEKKDKQKLANLIGSNLKKSKQSKVKKITLIAIVLFTVLAFVLYKISKKGSIPKSHEVIRDYTGNCMCPGDVDDAGRRCGERSAYSRGA